MSIYFHHAKAIIHDQFCFTNFAFVCGKERSNYPIVSSPIHGAHDGEIFSSVCQSVRKLQPF